MNTAPVVVILTLPLGLAFALAGGGAARPEQVKDTWGRVVEDDRSIKIVTDQLEAVIPKKSPKQWMTGIEKGSFLDKKTGFREAGDGLMVVDWLMEPGSDAAWADKVIAKDGHGVGRFNRRAPKGVRRATSRRAWRAPPRSDPRCARRTALPSWAGPD